MSLAPASVTAAWHHRGAGSGFEVVYFGARGDGCQIEGWTAAVEDSVTWVVEYAAGAGAAWAARGAVIRGRSAAGFCSARLEADGHGLWLVDGKPARRLDGCLDVSGARQPARPCATVSKSSSPAARTSQPGSHQPPPACATFVTLAGFGHAG